MGTIDNITGVKIQSAFFASETAMELFPISDAKKNRIALLYGKNGSGKSTLAQGFREYRDSVIPAEVQLSLCSGNDLVKITGAGKADRIFVFDEEYVAKRIQIEDSGLDSIVLFGEQVDLEDQIAAIEKSISEKKDEETHLATESAKFTNSADVNSPERWFNQMIKELKRDNGWAAMGGKIKGAKKNLSVTEAEIERIGTLVPAKPCDELQSCFDSDYTKYSAVSTDATAFKRAIAQIASCIDQISTAKGLLSKPIELPVLTSREKELLKLFGIPGVSSAKSFLATGSAICEKCFQPISDDYRTAVLHEIDQILNRDIDALKRDLECCRLHEIELSIYFEYQNLPSYNALRERLDVYNIAVKTHNAVIQTKIDNPFEALDYDETICAMEANEAVNQALAELEADRAHHDHVVDRRKDARDALLKTNDDLAHYSIAEMYASYKEQIAAKKAAEEKLRLCQAELKSLENQKVQLDAQRKNFRLAVDEINSSLEYIFYSKNRLSLELGTDQKYHLRANGNPVKPNKVSCGERNALALSYFFTEIASDMAASSIYSAEMLLVIDDPISSFDLENRIGVLSLLRWKLECVLAGCATTKVLLMTHDASTVFDMEKGLKEIRDHLKNKKPSDYSRLELKGRMIAKISNNQWDRWNEYTQLLERIYEYAKDGVGDELVIGNMMRRVLEAFSTFLYKKGIDSISADDDILGLIPSEKQRQHYKNLMYRLVLHDESHYEDHIKGMRGMNFAPHLSSADKQRTAREILCFMYLLNKLHILSHIGSAEADLDKWCEAI